MAEKKFGLGTVLLIGAAAAAVAGGVISYIKRAEIKRLAEEIITKVKPTDTDGVYTADLDGDGQPDVILADLDGDGRIDTVAVETGEPNIIDSGISLESVENSADQPASETQPEAEPGTETEAEPGTKTETETEPETEAEADTGADAPAQSEGETESVAVDGSGGQDKKTGKNKIKFWSK